MNLKFCCTRPRGGFRASLSRRASALRGGASVTSPVAQAIGGADASASVPVAVAVPSDGSEEALLEVSSEEVEDHAGLMVTIRAPDMPIAPRRQHMCCVIDISGSMGADASVKDADGNTESSGLSVLDIVKHSILTVLATMSTNDSMSIVTFHTHSEVVCKYVRCDDAGRATLQSHINNMSPQASTNLWSGLRDGLDLVVNDPHADETLASVYVFTDGMPNIEPPRGHIPTLKRYLEDVGRLPCIVNTFGFGYSMDSKLLQDVARICAGSYSFIPDAGMVGTVFIHACANTFSSFAMDAQLSIGIPSDQTLTGECLEALQAMYDADIVDWGLLLHIGSLQYGHARNILLQFEAGDANANDFDMSVSYRLSGASNRERVEPFVENSSESRAGDALVTAQRNRIGFLLNILANENNSWNSSLADLVNDVALNMEKVINGMPQGDSRAYVAALLEDVEGQVKEAVSKPEYYNRWGVHYLRSLLFAHALEICNNFKDPGVQNYGSGELFKSLRDRAEAAFDTVPPPTPKPRTYASYGHGMQSASVPMATPLSSAMMRSMYLSRARGCFAGNCLVTMANDVTGNKQRMKRIDAIIPGDTILSWNMKPATVKYVVRFNAGPTSDPLVQLPSGLVITPYHPVYVPEQGEWAFPCELPQASLVESQDNAPVYNFVLEEGHAICVQGHMCVTLGHSFKEKCVAHPYFGSSKIVEDLSRASGSENGFISLAGDCFVRDSETQLICGMDISKDAALGTDIAF